MSRRHVDEHARSSRARATDGGTSRRQDGKTERSVTESSSQVRARIAPFGLWDEAGHRTPHGPHDSHRDDRAGELVGVAASISRNAPLSGSSTTSFTSAGEST